MASNYERRITLYINGQAVKNDLKSIRAEMQKLVNEQARMTIGSKEYLAHAAKIRQLKGILDEHRQQVQAVSKSWDLRKMGQAFNDYLGLITAAVASLTAVILGFRKVVQTFNDFEERVDNLSALTGLAGEELDWLSQKAKDLSVSTLEAGIRVTQGAQQIVDAFTKVGSARPELLKDKEALVKVTEEAIILSNAAKTELQPAIEALTMVMNQYNVPATEARRIINALGAGSKEGAGEIPYLTTAFEKAGTVAADAGLSIETLVATVETLAPRITAPEIAGRSLKGVLLDLQNSTDDVNPSIVGMSTALENLGKKHLSITELTKMFGTENITTAKILINNVEELKKYEKAVTGTNIAVEQAATNTDNNNAKLSQAKNRLNLISIELGEKLAPAMTFSTNSLSYMIKAVMTAISFFKEYGRIIVPTVSFLAAYAIAVSVATLWENRHNTAKGIGLALSKLKVFWHSAERGALLLAAAAQALFTGNLVRATAAMRLFNTVTKLNPIGLLVGLLAAAGTAWALYSKRLSQVQVAQKVTNEINVTAQKNAVEEKLRILQLLALAKDELMSKEVRIAAIKELNALSPKYLGNLSLESINTDAATKSVEQYIETLLQKARVMAAQDKLVEIEKQRLDDLASGTDRQVGIFQRAWASIASVNNVAVYNRLLEQKATENAAAATEDYLAKVKAVTAIAGKYSFVVREDGEVKGSSNSTLDKSYDEDDTVQSSLSPEDRKARAEKLREFFALDQQDQQDALRAELYRLGKEGAQALAQGIEDEIAAAKENYDLLTSLTTPEEDRKDVAGDYALAHYYETLEGQKTLLMAQHEAMLISEQEFQDKMVALSREAEEKKMQHRIDAATQYQEITYAAANFATTLMEMELQMAGDNEEKKNKIRKKYADMQMVVAIGQIIANTSVAIMKALAELGPVGGPFAAAFIGATGAAELGMAVVERNRMKALYAGGYTGDGDKYEEAGIVHKGEYVIPQEGVSNPKLLPLIELIESARRNNRLARLDLRPSVQSFTRQQGFARGGFTSMPQMEKHKPEPGMSLYLSDPEMKSLLTELNQTLKRGIRAEVPKYGTNSLDEAMTDITKFRSRVFKNS